MVHRPVDMTTSRYLFPAAAALFVCLFAPASAWAQNASASPTLQQNLQPTLSEVQNAVAAADIRHWKAPGAVKDREQQNATSIQNDLSNTLPGLIGQADAAPGSISATFAVYRNVDALYDVLLRITETARAAAPGARADQLESALTHLESARTSLADTILANTRAQEAEVTRLTTFIQKAQTAQAAPSHTTVVDDGAAPKTVHRRKKKPTQKPAQTPAQSNSTANPQ